MFTHARDLPAETAACDVLVVGSGPAGLACALELRRLGASVLLLESGQRRAARSPLNEVVSTGLPFVGAMTGRVRGFGGTGERWSGQCLPLDDGDLAERPWAPGGGWPLTADDLHPWLAQAADFLGIGRVGFTLADLSDIAGPDATAVGAALAGEDLEVRVLHHSPHPRVGATARRDVAADPGLQVVLGATVVEVLVRGGSAVGVRARSRSGGEWIARAPATVLACGAIENTRLLLTSGPDPAGLGGGSGHLGTGFQDHPYWYLGEVVAARPETRAFFQARSVDGHLARPKLALTPAAQQREGLLAAVADLQVHHGPGSPVGAAKRITEAARQGRLPESLPRELVRVATGTSTLAREARHRRRGRAAPPDDASRQVLRVQTEQPPQGPSRVRLSDSTDSLGARLVTVDWHVGEAEHRAAVAAARAFSDAARRTGLATVRLVPWLDDRAAFVRAARDYFHHAGTTRMAVRPEEGVVDPHGAVHGVEGLYVAGGSVFPSSGYANPTLTIVALALRLAGHLAARSPVRSRAASSPGAR